jgi:hypothetical protein
MTIIKIIINSIRFDSIRFDSIRFDSIRFDSIRFDSIRFDSIRWIIIYGISLDFRRFFIGIIRKLSIIVIVNVWLIIIILSQIKIDVSTNNAGAGGYTSLQKKGKLIDIV